MVDVWPYSTQGTSDRTDWRTFMLRVHPSNSLASKKKPSHLLEQGKQTVVQPYSEKLYAWPLELGMDLWLCTPARLHQISAQSVNQAHTLPLRPGLKINPISLTSRGLTVIHRDEHCGLLTHTHTHRWPNTDRETLPRRRASPGNGW